jgi:hypothetical protein
MMIHDRSTQFAEKVLCMTGSGDKTKQAVMSGLAGVGYIAEKEQPTHD